MDFRERLAVVTGGGSGMGRELVRQLMNRGCNVATCDLSAHALNETVESCTEFSNMSCKLITFVADVSKEKDLRKFKDYLVKTFQTEKIHFLFNNAGVGGGGSFVDGDRSQWERSFAINWGGVYTSTRVFLPLLKASDKAHIINTSSLCGFWASVNPHQPNTAYASAKFAIRGFTEALITDLRINAPHVKCSVVLPGVVGTPLFANTQEILTGKSMDDPVSFLNQFSDAAPTSVDEAVETILKGVSEEKWRILVGKDANFLDEMVRSKPEEAYEQDFYEQFVDKGSWSL